MGEDVKIKREKSKFVEKIQTWLKSVKNFVIFNRTRMKNDYVFAKILKRGDMVPAKYGAIIMIDIKLSPCTKVKSTRCENHVKNDPNPKLILLLAEKLHKFSLH